MIFYHVSDKIDLDKKIIYPRIPKSTMNNEDKVTPRICVSMSINGCLTGAGRYKVGERLFIYRCESNDFYQPTIEEVLDVPITGEIWILHPVKFHLFLSIEILSVSNNVIGDMEIYNYSYKKTPINFD